MRIKALREERAASRRHLSTKYADQQLVRQQSIDRDAKKALRENLSIEKEKYAELLEKYISMMEKAAKLCDPGDEVTGIFSELESMLLAWYAANYYDDGLAKGFERIKKKYTEGKL